jgi:hypothetical protein
MFGVAVSSRSSARLKLKYNNDVREPSIRQTMADQFASR